MILLEASFSEKYLLFHSRFIFANSRLSVFGVARLGSGLVPIFSFENIGFQSGHFLLLGELFSCS